MKRLLCLTALLACLFIFNTPAQAGSGHYVSGLEGHKAATLPPPGFYLKNYFVTYNADKSYMNGRQKGALDNASLFVYALRPIKVWDVEIFGANLVTDMVIPVQYADIELNDLGGNASDSRWAFGDIMIEPFLLAWHGERWDAAAGVGFYLPTGEYHKPGKGHLADAGLGYYTIMFTLGGTYYFDEEKTWSASVLSRYETHSQQEYTRLNVGDSFHFEWGVGKDFANGFSAAVTGYCEWQIEKNHYDGRPNGFDDRRYQAYAVGPEIGYVFADWGVIASLRSQWELGVHNGNQGNITTLSLTKVF